MAKKTLAGPQPHNARRSGGISVHVCCDGDDPVQRQRRKGPLTRTQTHSPSTTLPMPKDAELALVGLDLLGAVAKQTC
jgi:hypothetical protein